VDGDDDERVVGHESVGGGGYCLEAIEDRHVMAIANP
jgi:hypothetical protein